MSVTSSDNCIRFGDVVCIYNPEHDVVLSIHVKDTELMDATRVEAPCGMSASKSLQPCVRNSFVIKRLNNVFIILYIGCVTLYYIQVVLILTGLNTGMA